MKVLKRKKQFFSFIFWIIFFIYSFAFSINITFAANPGDLLIDRIQIIGDEEKGTSKEDYIRIYNNTNQDIKLEKYKLLKRTQNGSKDISIKSWRNDPDIIKAHGYYLWANNNDGFAKKIGADTSNANYISDDNGIAIKDRETGATIDAVGWGDFQNELVETTPAKNPSFGEYLQRKNKQDTNNNSKDFEIIIKNKQESKPADKTTDNPPQDTKQITNNLQIGTSSPATTIFSDKPYTNLDPEAVKESEKEKNNNGSKTKKQKENQQIKPKIVINEILPNPIGIDNPSNCIACGEFIELYNYGDDEINLANWKFIVDNQQIYNFKYKIIKPKQALAFYRQNTKLILQNSQGTIELFSPQKLIQTVNYDLANEGYSYSLLEGTINLNQKWVWSKKISPQEFNYWIVPKNKPPIGIFYLPSTAKLGEEIILDASDSYDPENDKLNFFWDFGDGQTSTEKNPIHSFKQAGQLTVQLKIDDDNNSVITKHKIKIIGKQKKNTIKDTIIKKNSKKKNIIRIKSKNIYVQIKKIKDIKKYNSKQKVIVTGIVIAPPNTLSKQYLYISDLTGGIQIYSYKKLFPKLYLGDEVQVKGELTNLDNEKRIKIINPNNIRVINQKHPLESKRVDNIADNNLIASLVTVQGKVIEKQNNNIYLYNSKTKQEIIIYLKNNKILSNKDFKLGNEIKITGIVRKIGDEFKIIPRESNDLEIIKNKQEKVLGEKIINPKQIVKDNNTLIIPAKTKQLNLFQYLFVFTFGVIIVLIVWIVRLKRLK